MRLAKGLRALDRFWKALQDCVDARYGVLEQAGL